MVCVNVFICSYTCLHVSDNYHKSTEKMFNLKLIFRNYVKTETLACKQVTFIDLFYERTDIKFLNSYEKFLAKYESKGSQFLVLNWSCHFDR